MLEINTKNGEENRGGSLWYSMDPGCVCNWSLSRAGQSRTEAVLNQGGGEDKHMKYTITVLRAKRNQ